MPDPNTVILGAGLAGLGCALELEGTTVYEASDHVGGHASSSELAGGWFDEGAHISHSKEAGFIDLIIGDRDDISSFSPSIVRNHYNGVWTGYPIQNNLGQLPDELRIRALTDLVMAQIEGSATTPTNYREWCLDQYGATLTDEFYELFTRKYWRREASQLATDWLGGRLIPSDVANVIRGAISDQTVSESVFAQFHYPMQGGFSAFFDALYQRIDVAFDRRAVKIDIDQRIVRFSDGTAVEYESLASSIPLPKLVEAITDVPDEARRAASKLRHTKIACVNAVIDAELTDMHWCYIYDPDIEAARVSFPSNLAPGSLPAGMSSFQAEVFRADDEEWDLDEILDSTMDDMANLFDFDRAADVVAAEVRPIEPAYVVSDHERAPAVAYLLDWLQQQGIHSMGLYGTWQYMWSDQAFASGRDAGRAIKALR